MQHQRLPNDSSLARNDIYLLIQLAHVGVRADSAMHTATGGVALVHLYSTQDTQYICTTSFVVFFIHVCDGLFCMSVFNFSS